MQGIGAEEGQSAMQLLGAPVEVAKAEAVPKDRTETLYRSLELKASHSIAGCRQAFL